MNQKLFPTLLILMQLGAMVGYWGDWRKVGYWAAAVVINACVTY